jgi:uncharacterized protein YndB with AHSA1/START domain
MAITFATEVDIARPPDAVYEELSAVERWPTWLIASGVRRVELIDAGTLGVGTRLRLDQAAAGRASTIEATIAAFTPPTRFALTGRDGDGVTTEIEASLAPSPDGTATRLGWRVQIRLPFRLRFFESLAAPQVRKAAALDLEAFRRRLETGATD